MDEHEKHRARRLQCCFKGSKRARERKSNKACDHLSFTFLAIIIYSTVLVLAAWSISYLFSHSSISSTCSCCIHLSSTYFATLPSLPRVLAALIYLPPILLHSYIFYLFLRHLSLFYRSCCMHLWSPCLSALILPALLHSYLFYFFLPPQSLIYLYRCIHIF
jgi:hypothetical protein